MRRVILWILLITLLVSLLGTFLAVPVLAANLKTGDIVTIPRGEVVDDDLYVAARSIIVDGTVNGDIFGAAQDIVINGTVNGGVTLAGRTITITGSIANGARVAGQTINVSGKIGRNLVVAGSAFSYTSTGSVKRDLLLAFDSARIDGIVDGNVKGGANTVTIVGKVGGDVGLEVGQLTLASTAEIQGKLSYKSNNAAIVQSGARIGGQVTRLPPEQKRGPSIGSRILGFFMIAVTGVIVVLLAGSVRVTQIADSIRRKPWPSLGWGALVLVATPIAAIIIMVTVVGIPLGLMALVLYAVALYLSQIPVALLIGRLILRGYVDNQATIRTAAALVLGLAILFVLGIIPVLRVLVGLLTVIFGLGAMATWLVSVRRAQTTQGT